MAPQINGMATDHADTCREVTKHADNLDTVKQRIEQAREAKVCKVERAGYITGRAGADRDHADLTSSALEV